MADGYDRIAEDYRPWSDARGSGARRRFLTESLALIPPGSDVLELGCGPGVDATRLSEGRRYTGIDLSPVMLSLAQERVPSGSFLLRDLASLDMPIESLDGVVAFYLFSHLPASEHVPAFARIFRWLRPGGVFCSSFPSGQGDGVQEDFIGVPMFFGGIGHAATEASLLEIGFSIERSELEQEVKEDSSVAFLWVIARKPDQPDS